MSSILLDFNTNIASITIARPEFRNALHQESLRELLATINRVKKSNAKVVVLSGAGDKAFCAGADLKELVSSPARKRAEFFRNIAKGVAALRELPMPVIAKVHGFALAGGMGLVAASDLAYAANDAKFGLPEIAIGLAPMIVSVPLERIIGLRALSELVLTGELIDAEQARSIGLVTRVYEKQRLDTEVQNIASNLAQRSRAALKAAKRSLSEVSEKRQNSLLSEFAKRVAQLSNGEDFEEGVNAFFEKRPAKWRT